MTYSDLISISPYGNVLVEKELTGQQIIDILEFSVDLMKKKQCGLCPSKAGDKEWGRPVSVQLAG